MRSHCLVVIEGKEGDTSKDARRLARFCYSRGVVLHHYVAGTKEAAKLLGRTKGAFGRRKKTGYPRLLVFERKSGRAAWACARPDSKQLGRVLDLIRPTEKVVEMLLQVYAKE